MIDLLKKLGTNVTFRPEDGTFRSKLLETFIANTDEESAELFSARNCDIQVSVSSYAIEGGRIRFLVVSDLGEQTLECALSELNNYEISDFTKQLSQLVAEQPPSLTHDTPKAIIRKNVNGMFDTHHAAQKLGCSQTFLKSRIPCSDYSYSEVNGKKEINEYYWSQHLIDRLCHIKINGATTEDVIYIAEECCDGDCKWAEEILVSLARPVSTSRSNDELKQGITRRPSKIISKGFTPANNRPTRRKTP